MNILHMIIPHIPYVAFLLLIYFITWNRSLRCGFCSDDIEGVAKFSDKFKDGVKDDKYTEGTVTYRNTQYNLSSPAHYKFWRSLRLNLGKCFTILGQNSKGHDVYGFVQDPFRHHLINFVLHGINTILTYTLLTQLFGSNLAFMATLLFIVNPVSSMSVAWVSGVGYLLSYFGIVSILNIVIYCDQIVSIIPAIILHFISMVGLLAGFITPIILILLGKWIVAIPLIALSAYFLLTTGRSAVSFRRKNFRDQNVGRCTYFTIKKPIIMIKTLYYYVRMMFYPFKLGLFHEWGYKYDDKLERPDGMFWKGLLTLLAIVLSIIYAPYEIKFGLIWFLAYSVLFMNAITAQQFVVDRYMFIPSLGFSIIFSYYLQNFMPAYWILAGAYMMRTICHLWTFDNETSFYRSNALNFPKSEIAWGNLGVAYAQAGWQGSAFDSWHMSAKINPHHCLPHYNLYNSYKVSGMYDAALDELKKCLNAETVHFEKDWKKEYDNFKLWVDLQIPFNDYIKRINNRIQEARYESGRIN